MGDDKKTVQLFRDHLPESILEAGRLMGPCPFCSRMDPQAAPYQLQVDLDPRSLFFGHFHCQSHAHPTGFAIQFCRMMNIDPGRARISGYDPDWEPFSRLGPNPVKNLNPQIDKYRALLGADQTAYFRQWQIDPAVLASMKIGFNGRYLVYPYIWENGVCYAARCVLPNRREDSFWQGNERFFSEPFCLYNAAELRRCQGGTLVLTVGEDELLILKSLGYPAIAVPSLENLDALQPEMFFGIRHLILVLNHSPEASLQARAMATRFGFKIRRVEWPTQVKRGYGIRDLAGDKDPQIAAVLQRLLDESKPFSPFSSPQKESRQFLTLLSKNAADSLMGFSSGFNRLDAVLDGIRGINVIGGPPKAGKSCLLMQIATHVAQNRSPVIYYDFENGRRKLYTRTLCRLSKLSEKQLIQGLQATPVPAELAETLSMFEQMLSFFRVVTDRKISPDLMRRHIDFLRQETRSDEVLIVLDSLHKLPFKDLSERRTGIDEWLRHIEAIRDEFNAAFLIISELSRDPAGGYAAHPGLASFKESGDIEYSADNAMVLMPGWDPFEAGSGNDRSCTLWLVASRESSPGKISTYELKYPFWYFEEH